jgi:APA family basic amino acid/polyamine antiporter
MTTNLSTEEGRLRREVGLPGAVLLGLGSMVGTGVFVSVGIAAGVAGPAVLAATLLAAVVAILNGLSSAQLAAAHPVSGGTYEYGYRWLSPVLGFSAGWTFLLAKTASAATAALGLSGYLLDLLGVQSTAWRVGAAVSMAVAVTAFVAGGIRRSNRGNAVVVGVALSGLVLLVAASVPTLASGGLPAEPSRGAGSFFEASALMFVAFTGYGRIATLGEEVREPRRVIPRAIILTTAAVTLLYLGVAAAGVGVLGAAAFGEAAETTAAPLETVARALDVPFLPELVAIAAVAAMTGVLLNLVLGLSRVVLAMARRGDAPRILSRVHAASASPVTSVWACGGAVALLALIGDVRTTWSFSAFTVLVYYALTNLAALRLPAEAAMFPRWIPMLGLAACLSLAFWVEPRILLAGLALLGAGIAAHLVARRAQGAVDDTSHG